MDARVDAPIVLTGSVQNVIYRSDRFSVARVGKQTICGPLPELRVGDSVRAVGRWEDSDRYGRQLRVETLTIGEPQTEAGLVAVLSSLVDGIGVGKAAAIVAILGGPRGTMEFLDGMFDAVDMSPIFYGREGMKREATALAEAWRARRAELGVESELASLDLTPALRRSIAAHYGSSATEVCRKDPYRLAAEVEGVGFKRADELAQKVGVSADSIERKVAALRHALTESASSDGHVYSDLETCRTMVERLIERPCSEDEARESATALARHDEVVIGSSGSVAVRKLADAESRIEKHVKRLLDTAAHGLERCSWTKKTAARGLERRDGPDPNAGGIRLSSEQRRAIDLATTRSIAIVTGGPGTGKTTSTRAICDAFEVAGLTMVLCAPTGRAAARLSEATGRSATTIHRALKFDPRSGGFLHGEDAPLEADVVAVDESSMIDVELMASLISAVGPNGRLVLVGDADQLPPVGPGAPFRDLCGSSVVPIARLEEVHRQAAGSAIVAASISIRHGERIAESEAGDRSEGALFHVEEADQGRLVERVVELVAEIIPEKFGIASGDIVVACPQRKGPIGVTAMNAALRDRLNQSEVRFRIKKGDDDEVEYRLGDRVMQTKNDYTRGVVNGDLGTVESIDGMSKGVVLVARFGELLVGYRRPDLYSLDLAYCSTCHKYQGAEFPAVVFVCHEAHGYMLDRTLLYTAVTRAKRLCVIVGTRRAVSKAIRKVRANRRRTTLSGRLERMVEGEDVAMKASGVTAEETEGSGS